MQIPIVSKRLLNCTMLIDDLRRANLATLAKEAGGVSRLAERLERDQSQVSQWLNGSKNSVTGTPRGIRASTCRYIEEKMGKPVGWLDKEHGEADASEQLGSMDNTRLSVTIGRYDTGGRMGVSGVELRDQPGVIESLKVSREWLEKNVRGFSQANSLCVVTGFGDSMRPMFNSGDPLILDSSVKTVEFDAVYFFRVGNEGFIKRLQRVPGKGLLAISENPAYRDWVIDETMDLEVFGRVLKVWRSEDF